MFTGAPAAGSPVSAPSLIFPAVAYDRLGNEAKARALVEELKSTWPDLPVRLIVRRLFHESTPISRDVIGTLEKYGYLTPDD